jgi:hypothetical protein
MPANDVVNATRLLIIDPLPAPKTTKQLQPSFTRDVSDTGGYLLGTLTASKCKFSRADICFSAFTTHASAPQTKMSFFCPPLRAIHPGQAEMGCGRSLLENVSFPVSICAFPPSQLTLLSVGRNFRFSAFPCARFIRNRRRLVGTVRCCRM